MNLEENRRRQSHYHTCVVCLSQVREYGGSGHQSEVQTEHDSEEAIGQAERPSYNGAPYGDCVPNPLQGLLSDIHWPIGPYNHWQDQGTSTGDEEWRH